MYGCYVLYQNNNKSKSLPDIYQGWHSNIWEPTWKRNDKKKTVDLCQQNVYIPKLKFKYFEIHFFVLLHP